MPAHDFRTKPDTEWTYYVVDHLPTMDNLYRYDTVEEAIEKYSSIPVEKCAAIGSSLQNHYEIDHIHKINGQSVLITDMDRMGTSVWRDSEEIRDAVSLMKEKLSVGYELASDMFVRGAFVAVPLGHPDLPEHDSYFDDKNLDPKIMDRPLSGINEVYVSGEGWTDIKDFLKNLNDRQWSREHGYPVPFVDHLNIRYVDDHGRRGQADVRPSEFKLLREKYERRPEKKPSLESQIYGAEGRTAHSKQNTEHDDISR